MIWAVDRSATPTSRYLTSACQVQLPAACPTGL